MVSMSPLMRSAIGNWCSHISGLLGSSDMSTCARCLRHPLKLSMANSSIWAKSHTESRRPPEYGSLAYSPGCISDGMCQLNRMAPEYCVSNSRNCGGILSPCFASSAATAVSVAGGPISSGVTSHPQLMAIASIRRQ